MIGLVSFWNLNFYQKKIKKKKKIGNNIDHFHKRNINRPQFDTQFVLLHALLVCRLCNQ